MRVGTGTRATSPIGSKAFGLVAMHVVYWTLTRPMNKFWTKDLNLKGVNGGFFGVGRRMEAAESAGKSDENWVSFRKSMGVFARLSSGAVDDGAEIAYCRRCGARKRLSKQEGKPPVLEGLSIFSSPSGILNASSSEEGRW